MKRCRPTPPTPPEVARIWTDPGLSHLGLRREWPLPRTAAGASLRLRPDGNRAHIIEIYHQRIFTHLPAKGLTADIECEARDKDQLDGLVASLRKAGYEVDQVELG